MTFQKSYLESAQSNNSKKPNTPQIKITNPLKKDIYVNAINLICDIYYSLYGRCEIKINGNSEFTPKDNAFKLRKEIVIPLEDQILQRGKSIEISIWNPINDDLVELSVQVIISELNGNLVLSGQAIDDNTMLRGISGGAGDEDDTHDIFPYQIYHDQTKEFLINTKGRQNMLLTMASSNILSPEIIQDNFVPDTKPDSIPFKINSDPDNTPDTQTNVEGSYVSAGTIRRPNNYAFRTPQTETEWYYVTEYLNILRDVTLVDNTILDDVTFDKFVDEYLLIDGQGTEDKEIKFNFNSGSFSQDVTSGSVAFTKTRTTKYQKDTNGSVFREFF